MERVGVKKRQRKRNNKVISLSASLPDGVCGVFAGSTCVVKCSTDPISDMRESITEMIREVDACDWNDIEELVYCYIALNSSDVHDVIIDAFLSLSSFLNRL
ncbi:Ovate protein family, C-terminal [Parasponia andersonii]|uniref:Transcription repressor n=1 Tax=Parasponia andersonii TaxID=3476 RepID=A0A2P5DF70_PARAD|nr:Ovate protein family, C-terminal [Parasponia andersonii]